MGSLLACRAAFEKEAAVAESNVCSWARPSLPEETPHLVAAIPGQGLMIVDYSPPTPRPSEHKNVPAVSYECKVETRNTCLNMKGYTKLLK